ncbi:hypothetical protein ISN45_Aa05g011040 [Arabidopsis thaliana x Arabidopsis arenosa]|uniref:Uncharacterized protein n=1 Tax=Arabidopsis thaliana x Arabidopsis arenosa TaxID=1240361 RepID=A0A8T1ZJF9_9BRAS|nr:hypothetical protein ISN45_Aa05g011040 [Arabidopsis thaliana x Arabidopsis arenosa]
MTYSLKRRALHARIFEGKELPQFVALFQHMVVLKGCLSFGYKNRMIEKGSSDKNYTMESRTGGHDNRMTEKGSSDETYTATRRNQLHLFKFLEPEFRIIRHYKLKRRRQHYYLDQSSSGNQGPRQSAAALTALTSGFNTSSARTSSPELKLYQQFFMLCLGWEERKLAQ